MPLHNQIFRARVGIYSISMPSMQKMLNVSQNNKFPMLLMRKYCPVNFGAALSFSSKYILMLSQNQ